MQSAKVRAYYRDDEHGIDICIKGNLIKATPIIGYIVYTDLANNEKYVLVPKELTPRLVINETISHYVGMDKTGDDIYENDILVRDNELYTFRDNKLWILDRDMVLANDLSKNTFKLEDFLDKNVDVFRESGKLYNQSTSKLLNERKRREPKIGDMVEVKYLPRIDHPIIRGTIDRKYTNGKIYKFRIKCTSGERIEIPTECSYKFIDKE